MCGLCQTTRATAAYGQNFQVQRWPVYGVVIVWLGHVVVQGLLHESKPSCLFSTAAQRRRQPDSPDSSGSAGRRQQLVQHVAGHGAGGGALHAAQQALGEGHVVGELCANRGRGQHEFWRSCLTIWECPSADLGKPSVDAHQAA